MSLNLVCKMIVAACGTAMGSLGIAGVAGHAPPWWLGLVVGAVAAAAGVVAQSPVDHQAIAEHKAGVVTPPPAVLLLLFAGLGLLVGCAHGPAITDGLKGVALDCGKEIEPAILPAIESIAAQPTKESAIAQAEILAGTVGWCVVSKGAAYVLNELITKHAAANEATMNKASNLQEVLNRHPAPAG